MSDLGQARTDIDALIVGADVVQAPPGVAWTDVRPHQWRRFFARTFDNGILSFLGVYLAFFVLGVIAPDVAQRWAAALHDPGGRFVTGFLLLVALIPLNALAVGLTGGTIGKWLFGIRILRPDGRPIGISAAMERELQAWAVGEACGVPIICLFTLWGGYRSLRDKGHAAWDLPAQRVAVHRSGALQVVLSIVGVVGFLACFAMAYGG